MAEDTRSVIDQIQSKARGYSGKELSPSEMANEFAKWDIETRVDALDRLEAELSSSEYSSTGEAAKFHSYESALRNTHEALRKVDR